MSLDGETSCWLTWTFEPAGESLTRVHVSHDDAAVGADDRTRLGLRIRAVGEHPQAADTAGLNVYVIRYGAVITSGLLSGLAGAFLAIGVSNTFVPNMTDGRGYIALAAMIFGKWTPRGAFVACLIFGLGEAIYANNSTIHVSQYLLSMLPYLLTLIVIAGVVGRSIPPAADGIPYVPGSE